MRNVPGRASINGSYEQEVWLQGKDCIGCRKLSVTDQTPWNKMDLVVGKGQRSNSVRYIRHSRNPSHRPWSSLLNQRLFACVSITCVSVLRCSGFIFAQQQHHMRTRGDIKSILQRLTHTLSQIHTHTNTRAEAPRCLKPPPVPLTEFWVRRMRVETTNTHARHASHHHLKRLNTYMVWSIETPTQMCFCLHEEDNAFITSWHNAFH